MLSVTVVQAAHLANSYWWQYKLGKLLEEYWVIHLETLNKKKKKESLNNIPSLCPCDLTSHNKEVIPKKLSFILRI